MKIVPLLSPRLMTSSLTDDSSLEINLSKPRISTSKFIQNLQFLFLVSFQRGSKRLVFVERIRPSRVTIEHLDELRLSFRPAIHRVNRGHAFFKRRYAHLNHGLFEVSGDRISRDGVIVGISDNRSE